MLLVPLFSFCGGALGVFGHGRLPTPDPLTNTSSLFERLFRKTWKAEETDESDFLYLRTLAGEHNLSIHCAASLCGSNAPRKECTSSPMITQALVCRWNQSCFPVPRRRRTLAGSGGSSSSVGKESAGRRRGAHGLSSRICRSPRKNESGRTSAPMRYQERVGTLQDQWKATMRIYNEWIYRMRVGNHNVNSRS